MQGFYFLLLVTQKPSKGWTQIRPQTEPYWVLVNLVYSEPHKVGNRIKAKLCWDSLYISLKD